MPMSHIKGQTRHQKRLEAARLRKNFRKRFYSLAGRYKEATQHRLSLLKESRLLREMQTFCCLVWRYRCRFHNPESRRLALRLRRTLIRSWNKYAMADKADQIPRDTIYFTFFP